MSHYHAFKHFAVYWGRDDYRALDWSMGIAWKRNPKPEPGAVAYLHCIEAGWNWRPRISWPHFFRWT